MEKHIWCDTNSVFLCQFHFIVNKHLLIFLSFQICIAVASPGPEPQTHIDKTTNVFSGHISLFYPENLNIPKASYPMIPAWDGEGHYAPTKLMSMNNFHQWKIRCQVPIYLGCSILKEVNPQYFDQDQRKVQDELNDAITSAISVLDPSLRAQLTAQNPPTGGPWSFQDLGCEVPLFSSFASCWSGPTYRKKTRII